jgi:ABC-type transporter Mla subunit MlaD
MQIHQNEIKTGILFLITFGVLIAVLDYISLPGVIKPLNTYRIYYDNANGIRPGDPVLLAGREIGKVTVLNSPVPMEKRPAGHPNYEACIDVRVDRKAEIYRDVTVRLTRQGLLGQQVIDFIWGDPASGRAENHAEFVGERVLDMSEMLSENLQRLTGPGSDLAETLENIRLLTDPKSELARTIENTRQFMETLNHSKVHEVIKNASQMTDTLKHEPWRLIWPSTKKYPEDEKREREKAKAIEEEKREKKLEVQMSFGQKR